MFKDDNLSVVTKKKVYQACVLSVLLYEGECWTPLKRHIRKLDEFHHQCVRRITKRQQWEEHISSHNVRESWGDVENISTKLMNRHLEWLEHLARMSDQRTPKRVLFGWLKKTHPRCGPNRRRRYFVKKYLVAANINVNTWNDTALSRGEWYKSYNEGAINYQSAVLALLM